MEIGRFKAEIMYSDENGPVRIYPLKCEDVLSKQTIETGNYFDPKSS